MATLVVSSDIGERESTGWEGWDQGLISERRSAERISTKEVSGSDSILTYFSCVERANDAREIPRPARENADHRDDAFQKTSECLKKEPRENDQAETSDSVAAA